MFPKFIFLHFFKYGHWAFTNYLGNISRKFEHYLQHICTGPIENLKLLLHLFSLRFLELFLHFCKYFVNIFSNFL